MRLDNYLVNNNLTKSRSKAQSLIKDGNILVNNNVILKASYEIKDTDVIIVKEDNCPYVSRGGLKLEEAINKFNLNFNDKIILDIGSSTGGFTDCALKHGAKLVYAVDVGTNQLDASLKNNNKVISMENTNIKDIKEFDNKIDYILMDVSFVSIEYLLPSLVKFINEAIGFVCLIKPQFEVGKIKLKNGIVKDKKLYKEVLQNIINELNLYNLGINKLTISPIKGGSGNTEFLALIKKCETKININSFLGEI